jgi:MFS family permease
LACVIINLTGTSVSHFWLALLLLGIGWNFLFIGATTLVTETYTSEERFKAQAVNDFLIFSVVSAASLSAGILQHHFGWQFVNYAAIPAIAIILISLAWLVKVNRTNTTSPANILLQDEANP